MTKVVLEDSLRRGALAAASSQSDEDGLEGWMALMAGGWRVVDAFDEDGRRFLVARQTTRKPAKRRRLSRRESEVAELAARGSANKAIALELGIGVDSVATYVRRVKTKLGLTSRLDLVHLLAAGAD